MTYPVHLTEQRVEALSCRRARPRCSCPRLSRCRCLHCSRRSTDAGIASRCARCHGSQRWHLHGIHAGCHLHDPLLGVVSRLYNVARLYGTTAVERWLSGR